MDNYSILGIKPGATKDEIKKAYRKMARKYHPDKSKDPNSAQKFIRVTKAYNELMDRKEDNGMFDVLLNMLNRMGPGYRELYNIVIKMYGVDEDELRSNINSFDLRQFIQDMFTNPNPYPYPQVSKPKEIMPLKHTVKVTVKERYMDMRKEIVVDGKTYTIPLDTDTVIIPSPDPVVVHIITEPDPNFDVVGHDIVVKKLISLYQYLYGGSTKIEHLDGEIVKVDFSNCINKAPIFKVVGKGLPLPTQDGKSVRGDMYVQLVVDGLVGTVEYKDGFKKAIQEMFPPIY